MKSGKSASRITYPALLGAVSLILLYGSSVSPTGAVGLVALAGVPCAGVVIAAGTSAGLLCWATVSLLGLLLVPDKFCVLVYAAMFGLYPVVKSKVEALRRRPLEILCKLVFFNLAYTVVVLVTKAVALDGLPLEQLHLGLVYVLGNVVFLLYDFGFSGLIAAYLSRMGKGRNWRKG